MPQVMSDDYYCDNYLNVLLGHRLRCVLLCATSLIHRYRIGRSGFEACGINVLQVAVHQRCILLAV